MNNRLQTFIVLDSLAVDGLDVFCHDFESLREQVLHPQIEIWLLDGYEPMWLQISKAYALKVHFVIDLVGQELHINNLLFLGQHALDLEFGC